MKITTLLFIIPICISAQTEFYLSTARAPYDNNCQAVKDSFPVHYPITSKIRINGYVWNPDSVEWCTTIKGFYRSMDTAHPPLWKIDNAVNSFAPEIVYGFSITVPVLDTLEHIVTAAYLQFPIASFRYKSGNGRLPFTVCSRREKIFESDSIHMFIESTLPATFSDSSPLPSIRGDSACNNNAIMTFDSPSDTSVKLTNFLFSRREGIYTEDDYAVTYSPALNSYSILIPLVRVEYLTKRRKMDFDIIETVNDTIRAVFRKNSDHDTIKALFVMSVFIAASEISGDKPGPGSYRKNDALSPGGMKRIYDLRGRLVHAYPDGAKNAEGLKPADGLYIIQTNERRPVVVKKNILPRTGGKLYEH